MSSVLDQAVVSTPRPTATTTCPVNSYNSWDPLEEVIVGRLEGATVPSGHVSVTYNLPRMAARMLTFFGGRRYPPFLLKYAQKQLNEFIHVLERKASKSAAPTNTPSPANSRHPIGRHAASVPPALATVSW